jgi:hypothetical protein
LHVARRTQHVDRDRSTDTNETAAVAIDAVLVRVQRMVRRAAQDESTDEQDAQREEYDLSGTRIHGHDAIAAEQPPQGIDRRSTGSRGQGAIAQITG